MRKLSESIWSDMQDRSAGDTVRKEDDVNLLDRDGFYNYIMEHYKTTTEDVTGPYAIINSKNEDYINIPILEDETNRLYRDDSVYRVDSVIMWHFNKDDRYIAIPGWKQIGGRDLYEKIRYTFKLQLDYNPSYTQFQLNYDPICPLFKLFPKDNKKVDNKFFLEVIDFIIDNTKEPFELLLTRI